MKNFQLSDQIMEGIEAAFNFKYGKDHERFKSWIGEHAWDDYLDGGRRVIFFGAEVLTEAISGIERGLFSPSAQDQVLMLQADRFFQAQEIVQNLAFAWEVHRRRWNLPLCFISAIIEPMPIPVRNL